VCPRPCFRPTRAARLRRERCPRQPSIPPHSSVETRRGDAPLLRAGRLCAPLLDLAGATHSTDATQAIRERRGFRESRPTAGATHVTAGTGRDSREPRLSRMACVASVGWVKKKRVKLVGDNDLKQNRISTYKFSFDQMLDPKGNTAVYLLYSYARINSILRKSGYSQEELTGLVHKTPWKITHPHERVLAFTILKFPETLESASEELAINKLCDFIYDVAVKISEGYTKYRILDDPNKDTRLMLCEATRIIFHTAFYLVGITPLEKI